MKTPRKKCIDPKVGDTIPMQIVFPLGMGKEPEIAPEIQRHLEACEYCREMLPVWYLKGKGTFEMARAFRIVNLSERGDPNILRKSIKNGTALLKLDKGGTGGSFVLVTPDHNIHDPEEMTLADFNRLE